MEKQVIPQAVIDILADYAPIHDWSYDNGTYRILFPVQYDSYGNPLYDIVQSINSRLPSGWVARWPAGSSNVDGAYEEITVLHE